MKGSRGGLPSLLFIPSSVHPAFLDSARRGRNFFGVSDAPGRSCGWEGKISLTFRAMFGMCGELCAFLAAKAWGARDGGAGACSLTIERRLVQAGSARARGRRGRGRRRARRRGGGRRGDGAATDIT